MFQRFVAILLIIAVISSGLTKCLIFASFSLNQKYIAEKYCVNKDKPWLHCEGKCFLMKKLKQAEEKEQKQERDTQKNLVQDIFCTSQEQVAFHIALLEVLGHAPVDLYSFQRSFAPYHPPEA
ncbi:hypothetical protein [Arcticibacter sp. MXS-1]|uniref:hypothetical protein n=1 Tax=Arcticibacter sp. MXS-1 TaxID=3341726 RepID=UPI0035A837B7